MGKDGFVSSKMGSKYLVVHIQDTVHNLTTFYKYN